LIQNQQHQNRQGSFSQGLLVLSMLLVLVVPMVTGGLLSWHSLGELDVWLHQKAGQEILNGEGLSGLNTYSFTEPEHVWTNHEWLFQVLIAITGPGSDDLSAGIDRWIVLRLVLTLILMTILLAGDRPWRAPALQMLWLAPGILLGVVLLWPRILLRPELVSYGLTILLVRLAERPCGPSWTFRQLLSFRSRETLAFAVTLLWAQSHGFSALAPLIWLTAGMLGFIPRSRFPRTPPIRLIAGTALLLLALLMTPNGIQGLLYPLQALGQFSQDSVDMHSTISELQPLLQTPDGFNITLLAFQMSLLWGVLHTIISWPRRNLLRTTLWLLATVAAAAAQRNLGFYAITFVLLHTNAGLQKESFFLPWKMSLPRPLAILPVLVVLATIAWFWPAVVSDDFYLTEGQSRRFGSGPTVARYPFQAVEILGRKPETRVFANVDAASLSLSRGKALVFIDGRTEAYSPDTWFLYHQLRQAGPKALDILDKSGTRNVLLTLGGGSFHPLLKTLLQSPHWIVRHADPAGVLLGRPAKAPTSPQSALASFASHHSQETNGNLSAVRQADLCAAQATLLNLSGQTDLAETRLRHGLTLCSKHPLLNHNLGNQLMQKGRTEVALEHFQTALANNPRLGGSALNAGVCLMKMKDFPGAEKMFGKACRLQPGNFQSWANHSLALQQLGQHRDAYDSMEEAVRLNPGNPRLKQALLSLRQKL